MLREAHSLKVASAALLAAVATTGVLAQAAPEPSADSASAPSTLSEIRRGAAAAGVLSKSTPEDLKRAEDSARESVQAILDAYQRNMPDQTRALAPVRRKSDQIANETMQAERDKALEFLGLDPQADTAVSIFLSWSMPVEMLRAYVLDAMWSGANVYFKGVPPGKELLPFITKDLRSLVYGKNAANIAIDPRMFDAFQVTSVPAIVFTTTRDQLTCKGVAPRSFESGGLALSYDACAALPSESYWKLSGAVTTAYALNRFMADGAPGVKPYVDAIAKGYAQGVPPGKEQSAYTGQWEDVLSPQELEMNRRYDERVKESAAEKAAGQGAHPLETR